MYGAEIVGDRMISIWKIKPKVSEQAIEAIRTSDPGMTDKCLNTIRWGGVEALPKGIDKCFEMDKPRRWQGLWLNGFEVSRFCPAPARECADGAPRERIWLTGGASVHLPQYEGQEPAPLYEVEFIGRKTAYPGDYEGMSQQEMIVDRMISMKPVMSLTK